MGVVDENGMIDMKVPAGTVIIVPTADAMVTKAADIQPESSEE